MALMDHLGALAQAAAGRAGLGHGGDRRLSCGIRNERTILAELHAERHGAVQLDPPTAKDIRRALQTLGRAGAPADLLEALEAWSDGQMQQTA